MKTDSAFSARLNRRRFLAATASLALPLVWTGCATKSRRISANDKINIGIVGCGGQGRSNTDSFMNQPDCRVIAVCDVDQSHLKNVRGIVNKKYKAKDCVAYLDYRELMARKDIDAVMLACPDHWHELVATHAAQCGKDIYAEKPLARTLREQQAIVHAVQKHKRIWQTGSWQRSMANFHKGAEIVRNGLIGQVTRVEVGLPHGFRNQLVDEPEGTITAPPKELDYNMWIGPSQMVPYIHSRIHKDWRWNYNTGGGQLLDWIGHHCDIAHWGLGFDRSGPLEIEGHGDFPPRDAVWNACTQYWINLKYPQGIQMIIAGGYNDRIKMGTKWIGTDGWVWVNRGAFDASNEDWKDIKQLPEELRKVKLKISTNHQRDFLDSVRSRQPTITPVETAHHSAIPGHLGLISMLTGRKIYWDSDAEKILSDPEASQLLTRPYRAPYKIN